jgi:hypothetical protein
MLLGFGTKALKRLIFLLGLMTGILTGLLIAVSFNYHTRAPAVPTPEPQPFDIARLSPAELETLALDSLTALQEKRGPLSSRGFGAVGSSCNEAENGPRQIYLGIKNARRLLPLAKKLTLESLKETVKTASLLRERRLISSVHHLLLDPRLGNSAAVWEDDLSIIHIGPDYAAYLTSDDEAMLLLGHELMHVAARTGRLNNFIENVNDVARTSANLKLDDEQKEELASDFIGAKVLKRYIATYPTGQASGARFALAFGYEPHDERLARAWQDFCASYNGVSPDEEHLSQDQTFRALLSLDPELKALIPDDAISIRLCR